MNLLKNWLFTRQYVQSLILLQVVSCRSFKACYLIFNGLNVLMISFGSLSRFWIVSYHSSWWTSNSATWYHQSLGNLPVSLSWCVTLYDLSQSCFLKFFFLRCTFVWICTWKLIANSCFYSTYQENCLGSKQMLNILRNCVTLVAPEIV